MFGDGRLDPVVHTVLQASQSSKLCRTDSALLQLLKRTWYRPFFCFWLRSPDNRQTIHVLLLTSLRTCCNVLGFQVLLRLSYRMSFCGWVIRRRYLVTLYCLFCWLNTTLARCAIQVLFGLFKSFRLHIFSLRNFTLFYFWECFGEEWYKHVSSLSLLILSKATKNNKTEDPKIRRKEGIFCCSSIGILLSYKINWRRWKRSFLREKQHLEFCFEHFSEGLRILISIDFLMFYSSH